MSEQCARDYFSIATANINSGIGKIENRKKSKFQVSANSHSRIGSNMAIYDFFKPETNKGEFRFYFELFEKKKYQKQTQKQSYLHYGRSPSDARGVKKTGRTKGSIT